MSSSMQLQTLDEDHKPSNRNPSSYRSDQTQEWVKMAQSWLSTFPEGKTATMSEFEAWFNSNHDSLPEDVKSMPRSEIYQILMSIQKSLASHQDKEANQVGFPAARFQRTGQWLPVYTWLESLDTDEVVKSKDIADWLTENAEIREELGTRHSRYHLMHYIKKCHVKILKRREKKKGLQNRIKESPVKVQKPAVPKQFVPVPVSVSVPGSSSNNLPKDGDVYLAKRNEALQKYDILVALENQLSTLFPKHTNANSSKNS